jgi:hypothetical protein
LIWRQVNSYAFLGKTSAGDGYVPLASQIL